MIAPHHLKPDRIFPQIKQRSHLTTTKPYLLFLQIKQRSPHSWVY
ncbi:hypothetical protein [Pseudanabaena yagii]|nr:hypothetical protein [Pseudanabaena yagii]